jgi:hypothetical protein
MVSLQVAMVLAAGAAAGSCGDSRPELHPARERAYESIRDLEFDYHAGKLSRADYDELHQRLKREALERLKSQEGQAPARPAAGSEAE